jgi:1,4-alpha-glucan branching enzyme
VRSTVSLEGMNALLEGRLERPADVLGPQTISHEGRKMLAVRAFLPDTRQAWVLEPKRGTTRAMRRIHPAGLYEALCPLDSLNIVSDTRAMPAYQLRVADLDVRF